MAELKFDIAIIQHPNILTNYTLIAKETETIKKQVPNCFFFRVNVFNHNHVQVKLIKSYHNMILSFYI